MVVLVSCPYCLDLFPAPLDGGSPLHCTHCSKGFFLTEDTCADGSVWYVLRGETKFGPYSLARIRELIEQTRVVPTDQITRVGARCWVQAGSLQSLFPQEDVTPAPRGRTTLSDSDELMIFDGEGRMAVGPLSGDGIRLRPLRSLTLGDFQILRKLGAGGMGAVYLAWQRSEQRHVALKILSKSLAVEKNYVDRFYREAEILGALVHPNIIAFHGVGRERDFPYFAMEYVEGISVAAAMRRFGGRLRVCDALHIAIQCAQALTYAHDNRIVHRDIKPENIMITRLGHIKLTDLGLAKALVPDVSLTTTGTVLGTPKYMSPEQTRNAKRADHDPISMPWARCSTTC